MKASTIIIGLFMIMMLIGCTDNNIQNQDISKATETVSDTTQDISMDSIEDNDFDIIVEDEIEIGELI